MLKHSRSWGRNAYQRKHWCLSPWPDSSAVYAPGELQSIWFPVDPFSPISTVSKTSWTPLIHPRDSGTKGGTTNTGFLYAKKRNTTVCEWSSNHVSKLKLHPTAKNLTIPAPEYLGLWLQPRSWRVLVQSWVLDSFGEKNHFKTAEINLGKEALQSKHNKRSPRVTLNFNTLPAFRWTLADIRLKCKRQWRASWKLSRNNLERFLELTSLSSELLNISKAEPSGKLQKNAAVR